MAEENTTPVAETTEPTKVTVTAKQPEPVKEPEPVAEVKPVVKPKAQNTEKPVVATPNLADTVAQIKKSGTLAQKSLVTAIENYMANMAPGKPVDPDTGVKHQYALWKTIHNLVHNAPASEFKSLWSLLLAFFNTYKEGVFHDRYLFRFSEYWSYSNEELNGFQRVLNLINLSCDPATRAIGLRQVNLDTTLRDGFSEEARQRLLNFYKV